MLSPPLPVSCKRVLSLLLLLFVAAGRCGVGPNFSVRPWGCLGWSCIPWSRVLPCRLCGRGTDSLDPAWGGSHPWDSSFTASERTLSWAHRCCLCIHEDLIPAVSAAAVTAVCGQETPPLHTAVLQRMLFLWTKLTLFHSMLLWVHRKWWSRFLKLTLLLYSVKIHLSSA